MHRESVDLALAARSPDEALGRAPEFSIHERDRRYAAVRDAMRRDGLSCLIIPHATGDWDNLQPDVRYLTCIGGGGAAAALVFPLDGDPIAAVREGRRIDAWKKAQKWVSDVRAPANFDWSAFFVDGLCERGLQRERIGVVGLSDGIREPQGVISYSEFMEVQTRLPEATFVSATRLLDSIRKKKSAVEIEMIKRAQICADAMALALRAAVWPGRWLHEIYAETIEAGVKLGCELPSMVLFGCDPTMLQTQLSPEFRKLSELDVILLEAEPKFFGYMAQSVQTVSMRPLSELERSVLSVSQECFDAVLASMKPGISYRELIEIWKRVARAGGLYEGRSLGHGLGLGQDRPWTTAKGLVFDDDAPVEEGDCFVLKPWVRDEHETLSGRVGDTIVVTALGADRLANVDIQPIAIKR